MEDRNRMEPRMQGFSAEELVHLKNIVETNPAAAEQMQYFQENMSQAEIDLCNDLLERERLEEQFPKAFNNTVSI